MERDGADEAVANESLSSQPPIQLLQMGKHFQFVPIVH